MVSIYTRCFHPRVSHSGSPVSAGTGDGCDWSAPVGLVLSVHFGRRVSVCMRNDLFVVVVVVNPWCVALPPTVQCEIFASRMLCREQLLLLILLGFLVWHYGRRKHSRSLAYTECAAQICWPAPPSLNECHLFYQQNRVAEEERFGRG